MLQRQRQAGSGKLINATKVARWLILWWIVRLPLLIR